VVVIVTTDLAVRPKLSPVTPGGTAGVVHAAFRQEVVAGKTGLVVQ
jgi:hypothetical protein